MSTRPPEAFERLIGDDCPGYVPRRELTPAEAARWIREAGGVPVVAHPGRFGGRGFRWDDAMADLQRQGLEGLEGYYGEYRANEQAYFTALARRLGMVVTGGSDYHGAHKPGLRLGAGRGGLEGAQRTVGGTRNPAKAWILRLSADRLGRRGFHVQPDPPGGGYHAAHDGLQVEFLQDATGTLPYANAGGTASAEEIHRVFCTVFHSNFAAVVSTQAWLDAVREGKPLAMDNIYLSNQRARLAQAN